METQTAVRKVIIRGGWRSETVKDVAPVIRETKTMVIAGHNGKPQYRLKKQCRWQRDEYGNYVGKTKVYSFDFPTDERIALAEKKLAELKANEEAERQEQAKRIAAKKADPRYELLRRFEGGADFEPWGKLNLEQLQAIADILDSVKDR
jgi:hypothetical protein